MISQTFDYVNLNYLLKVLENYGFSQDFLQWISILLFNKESHVINGGKMMPHLPSKSGTRQGDPISAYLFILVHEIVFIFIKESTNVQDLTIFNS